jgi:hypothetical protein
MTEHLPADLIAAMAEGRLSATEWHDATAHLRVCAVCTQQMLLGVQLADLDELGLLPEPSAASRAAAAAMLRKLSGKKLADRRASGGIEPPVDPFWLAPIGVGVGSHFDTEAPSPPMLAGAEPGGKNHDEDDRPDPADASEKGDQMLAGPEGGTEPIPPADDPTDHPDPTDNDFPADDYDY